MAETGFQKLVHSSKFLRLYHTSRRCIRLSKSPRATLLHPSERDFNLIEIATSVSSKPRGSDSQPATLSKALAPLIAASPPTFEGKVRNMLPGEERGEEQCYLGVGKAWCASPMREYPKQRRTGGRVRSPACRLLVLGEESAGKDG
ncbi:hypothetical protein BT69DRAFT_1299449 [Atractiella rhizophila]|nr:hypothetical protein BT69DRAFT_1299449 [Atractiella rhizophila]